VSTPPPRRTLFTTLVGVAAILLGGLGSVFSLFALLLAIGKPYASSADPLGIFLIFILPPGTLLAGIGLLLRWRWARWWMILLMAGLVALGVRGWLAPEPAYAPLPGPAADAAKRAQLALSVGCAAVGGLVLLGLFSRSVRQEFAVVREPRANLPPALPHRPAAVPAETGGNWRVGHEGRDMMYYEERHGIGWRRIDIDGEMLTGRAHHVIYFADAETWQRYPEWARHRRDEIIARIKSRFTEPDYEYDGGGTARGENRTPNVSSHALPDKSGGLLVPVGCLALLAAGAFWLAAQGVERGETRLPARYAGRHIVSKEENPALFWTCIATIAGFGTACGGFGLWLVFAARRRP